MSARLIVNLDGLRLAYRALGPADAPPLLLLHALGEQAADWDAVAAGIAGPRRVLAPDLRGHGASGRPGEYSLDLMVGDVLGLLDALGLGRVDVVGHSMGGIVAYLLAARHPARVGRLVLEDVAAPRPRAKVAPTRPEGELPYDWQMVLAIRAQIDQPDPVWLDLLGRIAAETLVIAGGPRSHLPQESVRELATRIPGARLTTIDAGHLVHATEPEAFMAAVVPFLHHRQAGRD